MATIDDEYVDLLLDGSELISDPLLLFIQEIELAIKIAPAEVWGVKNSIDLNKYVFNQYITINQIKSEIETFIATYCQHAANFSYDVDVEIYNVEGKEFIYIVLKIYNKETTALVSTQKVLLN